MGILKNIRNDIDWFNNNPDYVYLDSAATSLKPNRVVAYMNHYVNFLCTNPHNDDSHFSHQSVSVFLETKQKLAKLLNTRDDLISFTPSATYSLNMISLMIDPFICDGDEIVLTNAEHSSNLLPWYEIRKKKKIKILFAEVAIKNNDYNPILKLINSKTKVVSFANATNLLGNSLDANYLAQKIKEINKNAIVVVDATQYLAHSKISLKDSKIDFLCGSAHKMLGPNGLGFVVYHYDIIDQIKPVVYGGGMNFEIKRDYYTYAKKPERFEAGTQNIMGIFGLNKAIDYYLDEDYLMAKNKIYQLKKYFDAKLKEIKDIIVFNDHIDAFNTIFCHQKVFSQDLAHYLGRNKIIVRSGLSCAKLASEVIHSDHVIRVSYHFYTNKNDLDKLLNCLSSFQRGDELDGLF